MKVCLPISVVLREILLWLVLEPPSLLGCEISRRECLFFASELGGVS